MGKDECSLEEIIGIDLEECLEQDEVELLVDSLIYALIGCVAVIILLSICGCCYCHSSRKKELLIKRLTFYHTDAIKNPYAESDTSLPIVMNQ
ncbi:Oidioi.mRNA.OKI2018_I69.XSR.g13967.t1.cds [Oikopleura dioica]|uniref:Oidioi.mRNA.OKI2018_I69.XSR.g13967.t1.cds n=1 Tax=Oikopleura dioica TaxID=34765 RepID=A0ABN7S8E8_OIKDI|nr:Oidioi.mRNA.OKI2018_I69.XSR.g13967.t1.cds [Oikopleura dioica]